MRAWRGADRGVSIQAPCWRPAGAVRPMVQASQFMITSTRKAEVDEAVQLCWRSWGSVGMGFAIASDVRFITGEGEATWVLPAGTFTGLEPADRRSLSDWLDDADGIDTVTDFSVRPWNVSGTSTILGVFETGKAQASWLIARYGSGWLAVRCADGFVSDVSVSLPDILGLIDQQRGS
jgi:hypothetical protein